MASCQQRTFFPGTFLPYIQTNRERWKRLIIALYKIDTYLAITREQAPSLQREELDVTLSSTFSLWNSWGLDVFFKRVPKEPSDRAGYKFSEVVSNPRSPARALLLIEDVQLGMCGLTSGIWNHTQISRRGTRSGPPGLDSTASLSWQLESWKGELERVSKNCNQQFIEDNTDEFPFTAYLGREHKDLAAWKTTAMDHIKCLVSNTLNLYHLQAIQLYSDTRTVNILARYNEERPQNDPCSPPMIQKHQARLQSWIISPESRKALLHAIAVLRARETNIEQEGPQACSLEPIALVAMSMSALVVWAWVMYAESPCSCVPGLNHIDVGADTPDLHNTTQLENWVEFGGTIALHGIAFCRCVVDGWMARYGACLPRGRRRWEMSYQIAPVLRPYQKE
ncbi:Fc.00g096400.m01.CDS01 [Cosmosporella sp. VM-42]